MNKKSRNILEWMTLGAALTWFGYYLYRKFTCHDPSFLMDFEPYYLQARALSSGAVNSYKVIGTKIAYLKIPPLLPLTYPLLLKPFVGLCNQTLEIGFFAGNICLLAVTLLLLQRLISLSPKNRLILCAAALLICPIIYCLAIGNLGILLSFLIVACLLFFQKRNIFLSAFLLALAASIKVMFGFLVVIFLLHR
jgi:hypothetical protein